MTDAREAILESIRAGLGRDALDDLSRRKLEQRLASAPRHTRPEFTGDPAERLQRKLEEHAATVERVGSATDVPAAVMRYLMRHDLPGRVACAPQLAPLPWPLGLLDLHMGPARRDERVSVTPCFAGVAETGSLVLVSGRDTPTTLNFVPEHHVIVLRRRQVVRHFEDVWEQLRRRYLDQGEMPRAINVISGPSRTADVEQIIQLGTHGPHQLHVVLVND